MRPKTRTAEQIDAFILRKHQDGSVPGNISSGLAVPVAFVHARMKALGIHVPESEHAPVYSVHPMWSTGGDELRAAIWKRQYDGARATLRGKRA